MNDKQEAFLDELIDRLYESDRYIDLDLMATIMAQGEAIVDRLIEVVETDEGWPSLHALLMLIEMRAEKALPVIGQALLADPELNEWVDTNGLDKFGPVAIDTLERMVKDETADWYPRAIASGALVRIAARYPETYERITAILRSILPDPKALPEDKGPDTWNFIISDLCQLRDPQAYDQIGQLFAAGLVDPFWMKREDYEQEYASTDPLYGVDPEPTDLLSSHRAMQESWRSLEAGGRSPSRADREKKKKRKMSEKSKKRNRPKKKKRH